MAKVVHARMVGKSEMQRLFREMVFQWHAAVAGMPEGYEPPTLAQFLKNRHFSDAEIAELIPQEGKDVNYDDLET